MLRWLVSSVFNNDFISNKYVLYLPNLAEQFFNLLAIRMETANRSFYDSHVKRFSIVIVHLHKYNYLKIFNYHGMLCFLVVAINVPFYIYGFTFV